MKPAAPRAFIDGTGEGWRALEEKEFVKVNCKPDTGTLRMESEPGSGTRARVEIPLRTAP